MGSYLGSCSGCSIDDGADMLKCTKCTKTCGAQIESSIAFSSCGSSAFGNNGGKLVCEDLPPGPYLRSCNNCNKGEDGNLSCVCTGGGGVRGFYNHWQQRTLKKKNPSSTLYEYPLHPCVSFVCVYIT